MPKRNKRKGRKQPKKSPQKNQPKQQSSNKQNLIDIKHQTIVVYNAGDKNVNGVYQHKCLDEDYFEKVGSIQSYKHSNLTEQKTNTISNDINENKNDDNTNNESQELKQSQNDKNENSNMALSKDKKSKQVGKFEIDRHEFLKNPDDIPDPTLNKSGVWIISRVDIYPKRQLYAVNCPFKQKIKTNGWIVLKHGTYPAPKIKIFKTKEVTTDNDNTYTKKKSNKKRDNIHDTIRDIRNEHRNDKDNKLNKMQLKALKNKNKKYNNKLMIVCGGQTGVERAALDVAIALNIPYSGWIPKGRKAEDGIIDMEKYANLKECDSEQYETRTLLNVVDSDATLILNMGKLDGGTLCTKKYVSQKNKDLMYITLFETVQNNDSNENDEEKKMDNNENVNENEYESYALNLGYSDGRAQRCSEWIRCRNVKVLNIAGPRESK
eukprot:353944_1